MKKRQEYRLSMKHNSFLNSYFSYNYKVSEIIKQLKMKSSTALNRSLNPYKSKLYHLII